MTDLQRLIDTFNSLNITFELIEGNNKVRDFAYDSKIRINEGLGYMYFYTEFYFLNEEIVNHAVWE